MAGYGGARDGAGRKSKAELLGLPMLIEDCIGNDGKKQLIEKIFKQAKEGSFQHQQLLMHYMYGKPRESVDITSLGQHIDGGAKEIIFRDYTTIQVSEVKEEDAEPGV